LKALIFIELDGTVNPGVYFQTYEVDWKLNRKLAKQFDDPKIREVNFFFVNRAWNAFNRQSADYLKDLCDKYDPYVVVWGKSDITSLKKTCLINGCEPLDLRFVNLLQLHTNYDNLKNSPGLFSMWETYNNTKLPEQKHNSLEDAMVTKDVFFKFKERLNG
jgi:sporulation inhibitor KapD